VSELEAELAMPPFPTEISYVWHAWSRIRRRKGAGNSGPAPIEWADIDAFLRRSGVRLAPYEIEFIEMIDDEFLKAHAAKPSPAEGALAIKDGLEQVAKR